MTPVIDLTQETPISLVKAAEFMGVHRNTITAWVRQGLEVAKARAGRRRFTTRAALQRFLDHGEVQEEETNTTDANAAIKRLKEKGIG